MTGVHTAAELAIQPDDLIWVCVCGTGDISPDRGVAVLVADRPIALFRLGARSAPERDAADRDDAERDDADRDDADGDATDRDATEEWYAIDHIEPFTGAPVMARGLVGSVDRDGRTEPIVASPLHKQRFELRTGACIDDPDVSLATHPVRVIDGAVHIGHRGTE